MSNAKIMLRVKFRSPLPLEDVSNIINSRADDFRSLPGLIQKYYLYNESSGEYAGLYLWESKEAIDDYLASELRVTIGSAYQTEGTPDIEVYEIIKTLRD